MRNSLAEVGKGQHKPDTGALTGEREILLCTNCSRTRYEG